MVAGRIYFRSCLPDGLTTVKHSNTHHPLLQWQTGNPVEHFVQWRARHPDGNALLVVDFLFEQYWLADTPPLALTALYCLGSDCGLCVSVTDKALHNTHSDPVEQYAAWAKALGFAVIVMGDALALTPQYIAKPWGQEIWFTGVEERGVCCIGEGEGETPIPWLQAVVPGAVYGAPGLPLVLLKILDPLNQPVIGDLYFELHEEKREVYVVTHIDPGAWPEGTGYIRFGFAPEQLALHGDDGSFRAAYLAAVRNYERVRRALDAQISSGENPSQEVLDSEEQLRREMDMFTHMRPLQLGDVVKVPLLTPHSLQHGVRTIEFQTPVYERKIMSFAQRVLTQDHWDTEEAVAQMTLTQPTPEQFERLQQSPGLLVERIVDFDDFEVQRVCLADGRALDALNIEDYALVIVVDGQLRVADRVYGSEQALLLPRDWEGSLESAEPAAALVFLLARPRNTAVES